MVRTAAASVTTAAAEGEATATVEAIAAVETATAEATALVEGAAAETRPVAGISAEGATENPAPGATVLVLLVGVGAVGLVGFAALMRENYKAPEE